ncbi:MAG: tyrosine-type recombinase/integrase [Chloroflexota bacterium]
MLLTPKNLTQEIILEQEYYLPLLVDDFLKDRRAAGLTSGSVKLYQKKINGFLAYCDAQSLKQVTELTPEFICSYLLALAETHNPGGVNTVYRSIRALLRWVEYQDLIPGWKNPIKRVRAPKVSIPPISGISLEKFTAMIKTCTVASGTGKRDIAALLTLLDTGVRVTEFLNMDIKDINLSTGEILIPTSKNRKPRQVYIGQTTRQAIRAYIRTRKDDNQALFTTDEGNRMTYDGLRAVFTRRAELAGLKNIPSAHDFRRTMALEFLRNGGDIYSLQRILGHSSTAVLWRYLAQTDADGQKAHRLYSPVDRLKR